MSKSSVPCKRAMRSRGLSWDGIRPKDGTLLGRMSTGAGRACRGAGRYGHLVARYDGAMRWPFLFVVAVGVAFGQAGRPPLFFREDFKESPAATPITQEHLTNPK